MIVIILHRDSKFYYLELLCTVAMKHNLRPNISRYFFGCKSLVLDTATEFAHFPGLVRLAEWRLVLLRSRWESQTGRNSWKHLLTCSSCSSWQFPAVWLGKFSNNISNCPPHNGALYTEKLLPKYPCWLPVSFQQDTRRYCELVLTALPPAVAACVDIMDRRAARGGGGRKEARKQSS